MLRAFSFVRCNRALRCYDFLGAWFAVKLIHKDGLYFLICDFARKDIPKQAGFVWDKQGRVWYTPWVQTAYRFFGYADLDTQRAMIENAAKAVENVSKSNALYSDFAVPCPQNVSYRPYQLAVVEFMRNRRAIILGDEMGIGKTIQAIGLYNYHCAHGLKDRTPRILIICPATLKRNWLIEWRKWAVRKQSIGIAEGNYWPNTEIAIINYDILTRFKDALRSAVWDIAFIDEFQYIKNSKSLRSKQVFGDKETKLPPIEAKCKVAITGTPIPNRPIEIYPVLHYLDPLGWPSRLSFGLQYCAAKKDGFGWDMSGASNLPELQEKLRSTIMIRRLKKDVLKDLPPKQRQVIEIEIPEGEEFLKYEKRILKDTGLIDKDVLSDDEFREIISRMRSGHLGDDAIATIRRLNGVAKIPAVIDHLHESFVSSEKIVCFVHHKEVAAALIEEFKDTCVVITGSTGLAQRQKNVETFQSDPKVRLFIGNILAAGTGITLTAANHVVFAELDWVPGNVSQAEDRCHRYGQKDSVLVQHLVTAGGIDSIMAKTIVYKQGVIEKALNPESDEAKLERMLK